MSPRVTLPVKEEGANVDGADQGGAEREGGTTDPNCLELNCASLRLMVAASMAHIKLKWSDAGRGTEKGHIILVITKGKMSLSRDVESL